MTGKTVNVGIISANWSLKVHGSAWRLLPGVEVAAICTAHKETAGGDRSFQQRTDLDTNSGQQLSGRVWLFSPKG
jgi:hypothetical protein